MSQPIIHGIYLAKFPYLGSGGDKIRPVIVISKSYGKHTVVAVVPISSKTDTELVDFAMSGWKEAGLIKPSVVRVHRLATIVASDLSAELGALKKTDSKTLQDSLRIFLSL